MTLGLPAATLISLLGIGLAPSPSGAAVPEAPIVIDLWPAGAPGGAPGTSPGTTQPGEREVAGEPVLQRVGVSRPQLHVYRPPGETSARTAVVVCPGGGFRHLAWDLEGTEAAEWLAKLGITAAVLAYRVPTMDDAEPWRVPAQDVQRALRVIRGRAHEWELDADRIGLLGFSAGACAAARVASHPAERLYPETDALDRVPCRPDFVLLIYPGGLVDESGGLKLEFTPLAGAPPSFLVQAADDRWSCENSTAFGLALRAVHTPCELHLYAEGGHGYGLRRQAGLPVTSWDERATDWLVAGGWTKRAR